MLYRGIDQHARQITISLRDENGDVLMARQVSTRPTKINEYFQRLTRERLRDGESFIAVLEVYGFNDWLIRMLSCRTAFRKYVTVTRMGPQPGDRKTKDHQFSKLRPDDTEYWKRRGNKTLGLGHVFKYPYAYYDLLARADDSELEREFDAKAWHLF